jgi:kumamolisin
MPNQTKLVPLTGTEHPHNSHLKEVGKADPDEIISVTLHLRSRNHTKDFLGRELSALVAGRRKPMTRDEWEEKYGADPADIKHIETVAGEHGLTAGASHLGSRTMTLMGTSARISAFFGVKRMKYNSPAGKFSGHVGSVHVPAVIAQMVEDVVGLDNRRQAHQELEPQWIIVPSAALTPSGFLPTEIATVYNFPKQFTGKGVTVGVIELGGGYDLNDIQKYCTFMKTSMPNIVAVSADGTTNSPQGDTKDYDGEVVGDLETIIGAAPDATVAVYFSKNTNQGFLDCVNYAVHDKQHQPSILSVSWGSPESAFAPRTLQTFNSVLQQAALLGITVCCASGDQGSSAGVDGGQHVSFPASSPYALACGGTRLVVSNKNTIVSETVWNNKQGASGGGFSEVFPIPDWQASSDAARQAKGFKKTGRGVPDVASVGDPLTGYLILVNGKYVVGAGTSAAAPLWAALIARVNESLGRAAGFINPLLYQSAQDFADAGAFRAITDGDNGFYHAGPGWNPCTGFGSPDGTKLASAMAKTKVPKTMAATK